MSRRPARATQADIRRAIAAMKQEGAERVEVRFAPDGTMRLVAVKDSEAQEAAEQVEFARYQDRVV